MPSLAQQKKKLESDNAELRRQLEEANARLLDEQARAENAEAMLESPRATVQVQEDGTAVQHGVHEQTPLEPELLYDPFDSKNPHKIIAHPTGFRLGWKNPMYREKHRGWRGWVTVSYDDDIGKNLGRYLLDPPRRMTHVDDNLVRRGDVILCKLPEQMWEARQAQRVRRANRQRDAHARDLQADRATVDDIRKGPQQTHAPNSVGGRTMTS